VGIDPIQGADQTQGIFWKRVGAAGPGHESQAHDGAAPPRQSIKCPYARAGAGVRARKASSEAEMDPRARWSPLEGVVSSRARRNPLEGGVDPRGRRWLGHSAGPRGPPRCGPCLGCVLK
jgi:hypothetical protein